MWFLLMLNKILSESESESESYVKNMARGTHLDKNRGRRPEGHVF